LAIHGFADCLVCFLVLIIKYFLGLVAQLPIHEYGIVTADRYRCQAIPRFNLSSQIKEPRSWAVVQQDLFFACIFANFSIYFIQNRFA
jgi:hypothetical protein